MEKCKQRRAKFCLLNEKMGDGRCTQKSISEAAFLLERYEHQVCKLFSNIVCESLAFQSIYKIKNASFESDKPCLTHFLIAAPVSYLLCTTHQQDY